MRRFWLLSVIMVSSVLGVVFGGQPAEAVVILSEFEIRDGGGSSGIQDPHEPFNAIDFDLGIAEKNFLLTPPVYLFDSLVFTASDVGKTFSATSATDPKFDEFVDFLTNGVNDEMGVDNRILPGGGGSGQGSSESFYLFGDHTGASGIDHAGKKISSVDVSLNSLIFSLSGVSPNIENSFALNLTVRVNETQPVFPASVVPEPVSCTLFGVGLAAFGVVSSRRRRRVV